MIKAASSRVGVSSAIVVNPALASLAAVMWSLVIRFTPLLEQLAKQGHITSYHKGGLFYAFVEAVRSGGYALPERIPNYTYGGLPFAYPPVPFYVTALAAEISGAGPATMLLLNAVFSSLAVVAMYRLLRATSLSAIGQLWALLAFATVPQLFAEHLSGEGLAEALGTLTFVLFLDALLRFNRSPSWSTALLLGALLALNVMSCPGTAYAAPVTLLIGCFLLLVAARRLDQIRALALHASLAGVTSLIVASPYLAHIATKYGFRSLADAFSAEGVGLRGAFDSINAVLLPGTFGIPVWHVLALVGLAYCLLAGEYFWVILPFFVASIPRENVWLFPIPMAVLAGYGISRALLPGLERLKDKQWGIGPLSISRWNALLCCFALWAVIWVPIDSIKRLWSVNGFDGVSYVTEGEARSLRRLRDQTPADTLVLMIGNENEWAPLLSQRTVLNVWYGTEWAPAKSGPIMDLNKRISSVRSADELTTVIADAGKKHPRFFPMPDLVYVSKRDAFPRNNATLQPQVIEDMRASRHFAVEWEDDDVAVFRLNELSAQELADNYASFSADGKADASVFPLTEEQATKLKPSRPLAARIGGDVEITGYDVSRWLEPGKPVGLTVHARLLRPPAEPDNWLFFAHLVERGGSENLSSAYTPASLGRLQPGDRFLVGLELLTDGALRPGLYQVQLGILESSTRRSQRIVDGSGQDIGGSLVLGPLRAMGQTPPAVEVPSPVDARLGNQVRLLGYRMVPAPSAGGEMKLTLFWQAAAPVDGDYTVFVHLVDENAKPAAQQDSQPQGGQLPTSVWKPGEVVADEHSIPIDPGLRGQRLRVQVGMYRLETGQRLPVLEAEGKPIGDAVRLTEVTVR